MSEEKNELLTPHDAEEEAQDVSISAKSTEEAPPSTEEGTPEAPEEKEEEPLDYEKMAREDLAEIKRLDPSYAPVAHLGELPFARRFAELRDLGLSVREALAAAAPRFARADGRSHLRAVAPRGARAAEGVLDRDGMREAKLLFGNLTEGEINALYRRVTQRNS